MRKFLRILLILLLIIIAVIVVAGLIAPKETNITSTTVINAPKEVVWEQMDTNQTVTYAGTDGEPGSSYSWKGEKTGEGTMTNNGLAIGQDGGANVMQYKLAFVKPFESTSDGYLKA